jgi:hypothetical protein
LWSTLTTKSIACNVLFNKHRQIQKAQSASRMTPAEREVIAAIPTIKGRREARTAHRKAHRKVRRIATTRTAPDPDADPADASAGETPGEGVPDTVENDDSGMDAEKDGADAPEGDE